MNRPEEITRILTPDQRREMSADELAKALARLNAPGNPVTWIHAGLRQSTLDALNTMGLHEVVSKSLKDGPERPRVEEFADHIYVSLFVADNTGKGERASLSAQAQGEAPVKSEPGGATGDLPRLRPLRLFLGKGWVISVGHIHQPDYDGLADMVQRQVFALHRDASFIAYQICEWAAESLQPSLDRLDDRIDNLEDTVVEAAGTEPMEELFGLKRDLVYLRRRTAPLLDVMQRLGSHGVTYIDPEAEIYFRDVRDNITRVVELLDTYRDILSSALDLHLSSVSNRLNSVMKQLTVVATVFLPLSFIVGFFGVNFKDMPYGSTVWFVIMFVLLGFSLLAMILYTKRRS